MELTAAEEARRAALVLGGLPGLWEVTSEGAVVHARAHAAASAIPKVFAALDLAGLRVGSATVARPSLDDVYLQYVGRSFEEGAA